MLGVKRSHVCLAFFVAFLGLIAAGCGDNGANGSDGETVFLYITNGYPGADSVTLYGPTGKLVSGLEFGARTAEPVAVDRNVNSASFTLIIDGAPTEMMLSKPLFSMYPQELGTLVISRRSNEAAADATLYRHIRTPDPDCVAVFGNSLSLNNTLMPDEVLSYSYQTEWNIDPVPYYDPRLEEYATTRCGVTPVPDHYKRADVHAKIANDPWFFPVTGQNNSYTMVWGERKRNPLSGEQRSEGITLSGQIIAEPTSLDFISCLSSAVTIQQEQDAAGGGGATGEQQCPAADGSVTLNDGRDYPLYDEAKVVWNDAAARACRKLATYSGIPIEPGQPDTFHAFAMCPREEGQPSCLIDADCGADGECRCGNCISPGAKAAGDLTCGSKVRIRTPWQDLIYQEVDSDIPGYVEGEGGFIEIDATFPASEQHFFVVFGRPRNAFVQQWNGEASYELEENKDRIGEASYPGDVQPPYAPSAAE